MEYVPGDWKKVELKGKPAILNVKLVWQTATSDLNVDLYNAKLEQLAASPAPAPGKTGKDLAWDVTELGVYYIRIQAAKRGDASVYTVTADWQGEEAPPPLPPPDVPLPPPVVEVKKPHVHHDPTAPKVKRVHPDSGVQGRIVSAYKEGSSMVLHIDKGSQAGIKVGDVGTILEGPSGADALAGGTFEVTQVIDENHCVAKTSLKSVGRNTRVAINTK